MWSLRELQRYSRWLFITILFVAVVLTFSFDRGKGASAGTAVQLIHPIEGPEFAPIVPAGSELVAIGDIVYFISRPNIGSELWRTDGTPLGTYKLDIPAIINVEMLTAVNDTLFLHISTVENDTELWVSDGTEAGTYPVKSFDSYAILPKFVFNDRFYFAIPHYLDEDDELWVSDGTTTNTLPWHAIYDVEIPTYIYDAVPTTTAVYFWSGKLENEQTLWKLDAIKLHEVVSFIADPLSELRSCNSQIVPIGEQVYFFSQVAGEEGGLWRSDGSTEGTVLVWLKPICEDSALGSPLNPEIYINSLTQLSDKLLFWEHEAPVTHIWQVNSHTDQVTLLTSIQPFGEDSTDTLLINRGEIPQHADTLYFMMGWDPIELWSTDGSVAGTQKMMQLPEWAAATMPTAAGIAGWTIIDNSQTYLTFIPWERPSPVIVQDLGGFFFDYPRLFNFNDQIYYSGNRELPLGEHALWRFDTTAYYPSYNFLPTVIFE